MSNGTCLLRSQAPARWSRKRSGGWSVLFVARGASRLSPKAKAAKPQSLKLTSNEPSNSEKNTGCSKGRTNKSARIYSTEETIRLGLGWLAERSSDSTARFGDERRESPQKRKLLHIPTCSLRYPVKTYLYSIKLLINKHIKYYLAVLCLPFGTHIAH